MKIVSIDKEIEVVHFKGTVLPQFWQLLEKERKEKNLCDEEKADVIQILFNMGITKFVRGVLELALFHPNSTGWVLNSRAVVTHYGLEVIYNILQFGSAILTHPEEPQKTFKLRREFLKIAPEELARIAKLDLQVVLDAENTLKSSCIHDLIKIAKALMLSPIYISFKIGDSKTGYRY